jgi:hypothetical protein
MTSHATVTGTVCADSGAEPDEHAGLRVVTDNETIDLAAAERAVLALLVSLGRDPSSPHLAETPRRVALAFAELLSSEPFDLTTFPNDERYDELVLVRQISVSLLVPTPSPAISRRGARRLSARRTHRRPVEAGPGCPPVCR